MSSPESQASPIELTQPNLFDVLSSTTATAQPPIQPPSHPLSAAYSAPQTSKKIAQSYNPTKYGTSPLMACLENGTPPSERFGSPNSS